MSLFTDFSKPVHVSLRCISGDPPCGEKVPGTETDAHDCEHVELWAEFHHGLTGHEDFVRTVQDIVQYRPPEGRTS